jgi:hypothetical protein
VWDFPFRLPSRSLQPYGYLYALKRAVGDEFDLPDGGRAALAGCIGAYFECTAQFGSAISTRRFFALPTSVALSATGLVFP